MQDQENEVKREEEGMEQKKGFFTKSSTKIAIIIAVVVISIGGLAVGLVRADVFTSPEKAIDNAMESLTTGDGDSEFESVFGLNELYLKMLEKGFQYDCSLSMQDIPGDLFEMPGYTIPNAGVTFCLLNDIVNKKGSALLGFQVADTTLLNVNMYADQDEILITAPQLISSLLSARYSDESFIDDIKNSYLSELLELEPDLWDEIKTFMSTCVNPEEYQQKMAEYGKEFLKCMEQLNDSRTVDKIDTQVINVDGKNVKCKGYRAIYKEEDIKTILNDMADIYIDIINESLALYDTTEELDNTDLQTAYKEFETAVDEIINVISDVELVVYTYNKKIAQMELTTEVSGYETSIVANFSVQGNAYENMELAFKDETDVADYELKLTHETESNDEELSSTWKLTVNGVKGTLKSKYDKETGDFSIALDIASMFQAELTGAVSELEKGEAITVEIETISYTENETTQNIPVESKVSISVLDEEISAPSGEKKDVAKMTEDDWNTLIMEAYINIMNLANKLSGFIQ